jgi:DNA polymerase-1
MPKKASELDLDDAPARSSRLFLVDGNSLAYRAFYALPEDLATSDGFPTGALLGFANMLMKLLLDYAPAGVLVAWDEKPTERLALHSGYKASRRPTPEPLVRQRPHLPEIVEAFGYRNLSVEGREADDVIGTLSRMADEAGVPTCVVSTDRDAFQLVSDRVCLMMTPRGMSEVLVYTPATVEERLGVSHALVPDLIGLKGDTSDDIPGVPGIGEKTAADLLQRYGDLEGVYAHLDEIGGPKRRQSLEEHRDEAFRSRDLATIVRDLPELADLNPAVILDEPPDRSRLADLFRRFEMHNLLRRLDDLEAVMPSLPLDTAAASIPATTVDVLDGPDAVRALTAGSEVGLAATDDVLAAALGDGRVIACDPTDRSVRDALADCGLIAHDFKDLPGRLAADGLTPAFDTVLAAYVLDPGRQTYALDDLARQYDLSSHCAGPHAEVATAALRARLLREPMAERLRARGLTALLADIELPLVPVLAAMEQVGVGVDTAALHEIAARTRTELSSIETEVYALAGDPFQIGSPKQLGEVLFDRLGLPVERRGKTGPSTDRAVLAKLRDRHPIVPLVERWRELSKMLGTYLEPLPDAVGPDGRIHPTFSQWTAATGRLSCTNPNLQAIPVRTELGREVRAAFVARADAKLVACDYSQVELRILAHLSGESGLIDAFRRGDDIHTATAAEVLGIPVGEVDRTQRERAKAVNFGIIYGISSFGLSEQLGIGRDQAQELIDRYLGRYPQVQAFIASAIETAAERGYAETVLGRQRRIPELRAANRQTRQAGERLAVNSVIQGSAADIIKVAMIACHRRLRDEGLRARLILQIHDELLFEAPADEAERVRDLAIDEMVRAYALDPPLVVDAAIGHTWLEAKA